MIEQEEIRRKLSPAMGTHAGLWLDKYIAISTVTIRREPA